MSKPPPRVTFFHAPQTRSGATRALFEELGVAYDMHVLDLKAGETRQPDYLAINPMGKVPAIRHGDALITEQPAVFLYLVPELPVIRRYIDRVMSRPAMQRAAAADAELAASQVV